MKKMLDLNLVLGKFSKKVSVDAGTLFLWALHIGDDEATKLMELLIISKDFNSLRFMSCSICDTAAGIIGENLRRTKITSLHLAYLENPLKAEKIWKGLENSQLITLVTFYTPIEDFNVDEFLKSLKNTKINVLEMMHCSLNDVFASKLARILKYLHLKAVKLTANKISDNGLKVIQDQLKYTDIYKFEIRNNRIRNSGAVELFQSLKSTKVTQLSIDVSFFSRTILGKIEEALEHNKRLYVLEGIKTTPKIDFYLQRNRKSFEAGARAITLFLDTQLLFNFKFRYELRGFELFQGDDDLWPSNLNPERIESITKKINLGIKAHFLEIIGVSINRTASDKEYGANLSHLPDELLYEIASYLLLADVIDYEPESIM